MLFLLSKEVPLIMLKGLQYISSFTVNCGLCRFSVIQAILSKNNYIRRNWGRFLEDGSPLIQEAQETDCVVGWFLFPGLYFFLIHFLLPLHVWHSLSADGATPSIQMVRGAGFGAGQTVCSFFLAWLGLQCTNPDTHMFIQQPRKQQKSKEWLIEFIGHRMLWNINQRLNM